MSSSWPPNSRGSHSLNNPSSFIALTTASGMRRSRSASSR
jgi:hypothetical protein